MSREELVKNLREIARINSISIRKRDICAEAADAITSGVKPLASAMGI